MIEGIEEHTRKIAIRHQNDMANGTFNENVFYYVCDVVRQCIKEYPRYVLLKVNDIQVYEL